MKLYPLFTPRRWTKFLESEYTAKFFEEVIAFLFYSLSKSEASLIKEGVLRCGLYSLNKGKEEVVVFGNLSSYKRFSSFIKEKEISEPGEDLAFYIENLEKKKDSLKFSFLDKEITFKRTYIMGVLNVTPDSFSDGGLYFDKERAIEHAHKMVEDGADIIDIGGQSTRPGSDDIPKDEEMKRVIPVIEVLAKELDTPISVDTYRAEVAKEAIKVGASIINDISALRFDEEMKDVVKETGCGLIIMHMKGKPKNMQINPQYENLLGDIFSFLSDSLKFATSYGIDFRNIMIDPGIGFGKSIERGDNFVLIDNLSIFQALGRPILLGPSRKRFIANIVGEDLNARDDGTTAICAVSIAKGANVIRVHDVKKAKIVTSLIDSVINER